MVNRKNKSGSLRQLQKRVVGGTVARYLIRKYGSKKCGSCKTVLRGMAKSDRIFAGNLCSNCVKQKLITEARQLSFKKE